MADTGSTQPQKLGPYVIERLIGKGGMGAVYLALDPALRRPVALKVLAPELAADPEYVARFQREAHSLAAIRHPNLVHIYTVGCDANRHFIAMEYVKGLSVAEIIRQRGPLPYPTAVRILGQVLAALDKVHTAGIVHRDLKPANIMIDEDQRAILMDFGLAKPRHDHTVTTGGTLIGTPEYMAPELAEGHEADFRSDLYAVGVILFELLTGRVPYRGTSAVATLRQHVENPIPSAARLTPGLPPRLDAILAKALAKRPGERYPSVRALATDLLAVTRTYELADLAAGAAADTTAVAGATAAHATPTEPMAYPTPPTLPAVGVPAPAVRADPARPGAKRRRRWPLVAAALGAVVGLALGAALAPRAWRALRGAREPRASQVVYTVHARGRLAVTGRLVSIGGEPPFVVIRTDSGVVERIPYGEVLRIEPRPEPAAGR